jgi:hypothetical protein
MLAVNCCHMPQWQNCEAHLQQQLGNCACMTCSTTASVEAFNFENDAPTSPYRSNITAFITAAAKASARRETDTAHRYQRRGVTLVCSSGYAATDTWNTRKLRTAQLRRRRRGVTLVCSSGYAATDTWNTRKLRTAQLRLSLLRLNPTDTQRQHSCSCCTARM